MAGGRFDPAVDTVFHSISRAGGGAGVNQAGKMTGHGYYPSGHVMFRMDGAGTNILPLPADYYYTTGRAIADDGTVVGRGVLSAGGTRALRYTDAGGVEDMNARYNVAAQGGPWTLHQSPCTHGT